MNNVFKDEDGNILNPHIPRYEKGISYSTKEVKTGDTWVDGKPIYRRIFNGTYKELQTLVTNVSCLVKIYGCGDCGTGVRRVLPYYEEWDSLRTTITVELRGTNINLRSEANQEGRDFTGILVVEYTKTTD